MKKIYCVTFLILMNKLTYSQDSSQVKRIDSIIAKIEFTLSDKEKVVKDTVFYGKADKTGEQDTLKRRTISYSEKSERRIQKISRIEHYMNWTSLVTIYYLDEKTMYYRKQDWYVDDLRNDFVIYYWNDKGVAQFRHAGIEGDPFPPTFLDFSYQILREK